MKNTHSKSCAAALLALALAGVVATPPAAANGDPFIGQVMCGGWNFAPLGWMELAGQLLPIAENEALFALIGTTWGGDGQSTFALPDLRGRAMVGSGQGPGLSPRILGERFGTESETLTSSTLPPHDHVYRPMASSADASATAPAGKLPSTKARTSLYAPGPGDLAQANVQSGTAGGAQPIGNLQPYLPLKCAVAIFGIFPSQN